MSVCSTSDFVRLNFFFRFSSCDGVNRYTDFGREIEA